MNSNQEERGFSEYQHDRDEVHQRKLDRRQAKETKRRKARERKRLIEDGAYYE